MRNFVAVLSGFCLTLVIFAGGALTAVFFVNATPAPAHRIDEDSGTLWTSKAVRVNAAAQDLERLPARPVPQQPSPQREAQPSPASGPTNSPGSIDATTTAAVPTEPKPAMNAAHVEWCSKRYRSYDPADNSYTAYSGARRECVSPYSGGSPGREESESADASEEEFPELISAAHSTEMPGAMADPEHVQSCFERYQSYRPEDNTYQPYGGGPRQQCE